MNQAYTLAEIARNIGAEVHGDAACIINRVASLTHAQVGDICFLADPRLKKHLLTTSASAVLLSKEFLTDCPTNALTMANSKLGFVNLLNFMLPVQQPDSGIHPSAVIGAKCQIDPTVTIGAQVVVGEGVTIGARTVIAANSMIGEYSQIGADCHLHTRVTLYPNSILAERVIVHSGAVIGADGFGFVQDEQQRWVKIPQIGRVVIANDVEIGANTTIDRGTLEDTIIGEGVKIDNQVMIGHNCQIGAHTVIAGCSGIAGSTVVGRYCMIGAAVGLSDHIEICDHVMLTASATVPKSIKKPGIYSSGTCMQPNREWHKSVVRFRQLDDIARRLKRLERIYADEVGK